MIVFDISFCLRTALLQSRAVYSNGRSILAGAVDNKRSHCLTQLKSLLDIEWRVNTCVERRHPGIGRLGVIGASIAGKQVAQDRGRRRRSAGMTRRESGMSGIGEQSWNR